MKTNEELQKDVQDAIRWEPLLHAAETGVIAEDAIITLTGSVLIDKRITWLEVEGNQVKASFMNNNISVSAWLYFNEEGALINFISQDRYSADAEKQLPWATPLKNYQEINGNKLMRNAETIYSYPDKDLCYGTFRLMKVEYNCKVNSD